jgi:hypothetical protein
MESRRQRLSDTLVDFLPRPLGDLSVSYLGVSVPPRPNHPFLMPATQMDQPLRPRSVTWSRVQSHSLSGSGNNKDEDSGSNSREVSLVSRTISDVKHHQPMGASSHATHSSHRTPNPPSAIATSQPTPPRSSRHISATSISLTSASLVIVPPSPPMRSPLTSPPAPVSASPSPSSIPVAPSRHGWPISPMPPVPQQSPEQQQIQTPPQPSSLPTIDINASGSSTPPMVPVSPSSLIQPPDVPIPAARQWAPGSVPLPPPGVHLVNGKWEARPPSSSSSISGLPHASLSINATPPSSIPATASEPLPSAPASPVSVSSISVSQQLQLQQQPLPAPPLSVVGAESSAVSPEVIPTPTIEGNDAIATTTEPLLSATPVTSSLTSTSLSSFTNAAFPFQIAPLRASVGGVSGTGTDSGVGSRRGSTSVRFDDVVVEVPMNIMMSIPSSSNIGGGGASSSASRHRYHDSKDELPEGKVLYGEHKRRVTTSITTMSSSSPNDDDTQSGRARSWSTNVKRWMDPSALPLFDPVLTNAGILVTSITSPNNNMNGNGSNHGDTGTSGVETLNENDRERTINERWALLDTDDIAYHPDLEHIPPHERTVPRFPRRRSRADSPRSHQSHLYGDGLSVIQPLPPQPSILPHPTVTAVSSVPAASTTAGMSINGDDTTIMTENETYLTRSQKASIDYYRDESQSRVAMSSISFGGAPSRGAVLATDETEWLWHALPQEVTIRLSSGQSMKVRPRFDTRNLVRPLLNAGRKPYGYNVELGYPIPYR